MIPQEDFFQFRRERPRFNDNPELKVVTVGGKHSGLYIGSKKLEDVQILFPNGTIVEGHSMEVKEDDNGDETVVLLRGDGYKPEEFDDEKLEDFRFYVGYQRNS